MLVTLHILVSSFVGAQFNQSILNISDFVLLKTKGALTMSLIRQCLSVAIIGFVALTSNIAYAGDDPVNCRVESTQIPVYGGWARCYDHQSRRWLEEYVARSSSAHWIVRSFNTQTGQTDQCTALLDIISYDTVSVQICDYTPKAEFFTLEVQEGIVNVVSNSSDRDGQIVTTKLWVNGVLKSPATPNKYSIPASAGQRLTLKMEVTDNDGYKDTKITTYTVQGLGSCDGRPLPHCF